MVVRLDSNNKLVNARPCCNCILMMKNVGINKVHYSVDGNIISEKISQIVSVHTSYMVRLIEINEYNAPKNKDDYYKMIIGKMPKIIKYKNLEHFINFNLNDIDELKYKIINNMIIILNCNNMILGKINII